MEDGFARDGVLARCNEDADALLDEECAKARRAATAVALEAERRERQVLLESESAGKLLAMRERNGGQTLGAQDVSAGSVPAFGAPVGAVMPSMQTASFDVYADGAAPLGRRGMQIEVEPPANDFEIESPELVLSDLAIVPQPLKADHAR